MESQRGAPSRSCRSPGPAASEGERVDHVRRTARPLRPDARSVTRSSVRWEPPVTVPTKHEGRQRGMQLHARTRGRIRTTLLLGSERTSGPLVAPAARSRRARATNAGSAFGISIRSRRTPSSAAPAASPRGRCPSESLGDPTRNRRADQHVARRRARLSAGEMIEDVRPEPRLAGRRLALERERPVVTPARSATSRAVSRSLSGTGRRRRGCAQAGNAP